MITGAKLMLDPLVYTKRHRPTSESIRCAQVVLRCILCVDFAICSHINCACKSCVRMVDDDIRQIPQRWRSLLDRSRGEKVRHVKRL